jgi:hypothetical protein
LINANAFITANPQGFDQNCWQHSKRRMRLFELRLTHITNNRNDYAHVYDPDNKVFKLVDKDELVDELIDYRVCDIEEYYMQYKNELDLPVKNKIEELIEHRGDNESTKGKIKLLLFNNRHKIEV